MKIFFALALVIFVNWSVVLGDGINTVEEDVIQVGGWGGTCLCPDGSTYQVGDNWDACATLACVNGQKVNCNEYFGEWSDRKVTCSDCGDDFRYTPNNLDGSSKEWSNPGQGIENCRNACRNRSGCTGFEYNNGGDEGYKCGTYTGHTSSFEQSDSQTSSWTSCTKNNLDVREDCTDDYQCNSDWCYWYKRTYSASVVEWKRCIDYDYWTTNYNWLYIYNEVPRTENSGR